MEWPPDNTTITGLVIGALVSFALWMIRYWVKSCNTEIIAQSDMLKYHGVKLAEHENKFARQDEKNKIFESTLERLEDGQKDGFAGVNKRLDDVIGRKRA